MGSTQYSGVLPLETPSYCVIPCTFEVPVLCNRFTYFNIKIYFILYFGRFLLNLSFSYSFIVYFGPPLFAPNAIMEFYILILNSILNTFHIAIDLICIARALKGALL